MKTVADISWRGKVAVLRADLNAPLTESGEVADAARIVAAQATIEAILRDGGGVVVLSHLGRPTEGRVDEALSLRPVAAVLRQRLAREVRFCATIEAVQPVGAGEVVMLENTRFQPGETANDAVLAQRYAALGDVFVMDAFASAHRCEASVVAVAQCGLPVCVGLLMAAEIGALRRAVEQLQRPLVGVFGGAKISTKLAVIERMASLCDVLILGGGIANTLLSARGAPIGASLAQAEMLDIAKALSASAGERLLLPDDAIVASSATDGETPSWRYLDDFTGIDANERILDIGEKTRRRCVQALQTARTIIWNGPLGLFEQPPFAEGTAAVAAAIAESSAFSLIGGGDTLAAARRFSVLDKVSYVSTGGGALLAYLAGDALPGLSALELAA